MKNLKLRVRDQMQEPMAQVRQEDDRTAEHGTGTNLVHSAQAASHKLVLYALSDAEFDAWLSAIAQYSEKIPPLEGETFSREMIYQDHD